MTVSQARDSLYSLEMSYTRFESRKKKEFDIPERNYTYYGTYSRDGSEET